MTEEIPVKHNPRGIEGTQPPEAATAGARNAHTQRNDSQIGPPVLSRDQAVRQLDAHLALSRVIAESNRDTRRLLDAVARLISEIVGDMCVITLLSGEQDAYRIAAHYDPNPHIVQLYSDVIADGNSYGRRQGWVSKVYETGEPLFIPAISLDDAAQGAATPAFMRFVREVGIAAMVVVPIKGGSGILGTLTALRHGGGRPYTAGDEAFLEAIAYRTGVSLENFTLIDSLRKELAGRAFAREALAASEQRFLSIFHSAFFGIKLMDLFGGIVESNEAFQAMSGYSESDLIAMHFYDLVHPEDLPHALESFKSVKMGRQPHARNEHRLLRKDGSSLWVRTTYAGVRQSPGGGLSFIFGMVENISEQKKAEADLRELQQHLQASIELERLRLAQNLHDAPLQELYAVIYKLEEVRLKSTDPESIALLRQSVDEMKRTLESLRSTASELRPPSLSRFGLEKAIRSYAEDFKLKHPGIELQLTLAHDAQLLDEPVRLVLFRVFQEALANVARHTQATQIRVLFSFDAEEARIEIADNGKGFDVPPNWMSQVRRGHYGLAGMAERVGAAGGMLNIESSPQESTTVRVVIPSVKN
jgi:PAS domain S-box-containing protein